MYFDTNESKSHKAAKEKLFDLIVSKRVKILDQHGNEYEIFTGKHDNEFLHIESFIMDYSDDALFSNSGSPCKKHLEAFNANGYCDAKGYYGAFKELPCEKCVISNFRKYINGSSKYASYRPDVAFGYEGKHKVWLEIKNESPCSENKINFCKENGIVLLEIEDREVNNFREYNGELVFTKLEEYVHVPSIYEDIENVVRFIKSKLSENKFIDYKEVNQRIQETPSFSNVKFVPSVRHIQLMQDRIKKEFVRITIEGNDLKKHFNVKRKCSAIITNQEYQILLSKKYIQEEPKKDKYEVTEKSTSDKFVKCAGCKNKEIANRMVRVHSRMKNDKVLVKYFHEGCFEKVSK